jgi:hypothetical protein
MGKCPRCGWINPPETEVCIGEGCFFPLTRTDEEMTLTNSISFDEDIHKHDMTDEQSAEVGEHRAVTKYRGKTRVGERLKLFPQAEEKEWYVVISRNDHLRDNRFLGYNNRIVSPDDIRELLPNGNRLVWGEMHTGISEGCCAVDGNIKVTIVMKNNRTRTREQIIREFLKTLE